MPTLTRAQNLLNGRFPQMFYCDQETSGDINPSIWELWHIRAVQETNEDDKSIMLTICNGLCRKDTTKYSVHEDANVNTVTQAGD